MRWLIPLLLMVACQSAPVSQAEVELFEFGIQPEAGTFEAGQLEFQVRNTGEFGHTLVVTDSTGNVVDAGDLLSPSEASTVSLQLEPGEYQLTCRIIGQDEDGNVIDHYERGMSASITVQRS